MSGKIKCGGNSIPKFTKYKTASINCDPILFKKDENIAHELALVEEAAKDGAKLIALPEMATTGYCFYSRDEAAPYVETIPGKTTELFTELAAKYDCFIVTGIAEKDKDTDLYYNSAVLIGPKGIIGVHRKTHPYISEPKWSKQGDYDHQVYETPIGNIGMLICMDIHFIETARLEALRGADVIVHVSNWLAEKTPAPYWITRAFENGCYVLESNRCGLERTVQFSGGSCLINPDGKIASYSDKNDEICYGEVDISAARNKKLADGTDKIKSRRPDMYKELCSNPYLWNPLDFFTLYGYDPLPTGKRSKAAVVQMNPNHGNTEENLGKIIKAASEAAEKGAELVVFPELCITGTPESYEEALSFSEKMDYITDKLIDASMLHHIYICVGTIEREGEKVFNCAMLTGPEGVAAKYKKIHLNVSDRRWNASCGSEFVYANTQLGRVGLMIGSDAFIPETGRLLSLRGCDILLCPSAVDSPPPYSLASTEAPHNYPIPRGYSSIHWHLWRVRGGENNCYMIFSNRTDGNFFGRSGIFGPDTFKFPRDEVILPSDECGIGYMTIDTSNSKDSVYPTNVVRRKDLVCMRQPIWYNLLTNENPPVLSIEG
ncbi:MAG: hypothetical protein LUI05_07150 [Oscillospiraceae bacterium]|nr:hypothetical protein [Oscillospiraceae bacterium]